MVGTVEETYVAVIRHDPVDLGDATPVGVVRRPTGWFHAASGETESESRYRGHWRRTRTRGRPSSRSASASATARTSRWAASRPTIGAVAATRCGRSCRRECEVTPGREL